MMKVLVGLLLLLAPGARAASSSLSPELQVQRVMLERALEERVRGALSEVLGTTAVVPVINVALTLEEIKAPKDGGKKPGVEYVLPGVPLDQQLTKKGRELADIRRSDRLVTATVFVGKKLDDQQAAKAKEIAAQILQINTAAGDSLELRTFDPPATAPSEQKQHVSPVAVAATALFALFALAVAGFMWLVVRPFLGSFLEQLAKSNFSSGGGDGGGAAAAMIPAAAAATVEPGIKLGGDEEALFGFINEDNLVGLVQALGRENEMLITSVLECLPRPLAAQAFALFPPDKRRDIVLHSRSVKYGNPESIRTIEKQIRSKLGFSFGGVRKMCRIVQRAGTKVRASLIADIAKVDPDLAKHLRDNLIEFEDVLALDDRSFGRLARELSIPSLARFLKAGPPEWVERVGAKLNPELAELLKEQVSYSGPATSEQVEDEFARIVEIVERLRAAGLIAPKNAQAPAP